jgi:hypothetical protein
MTVSTILFDAGRITGLLLHYEADDFRDAARTPGLSPAYQRILEELAELREALDSPGPTWPPLKE